MINSQKQHLIGYVHSTQGLRGELFLALKSTDDSWLEIWENLILVPPSKTDSTPASLELPIHSLRLHKKQGKHGVVVRLKTLTNVDEAAVYVGYAVWIPEDFLQSKEGEALFLKEIEGFFVSDEWLGDVGPIVGFSSNGAQDLIEVFYKNKNHYIPLVKDFVVRVDKKNKKVFMRIPQGLLDL